MKPREQGGVVDLRLNVYGVQGLKVVGNYYSYFLKEKNQYIFNPPFFFQTSVSHQAM